MIFHIVAILLLALLTVDSVSSPPREILLTATLSKLHSEGGEKHEEEHADAAVIEDPGPEQAEEPKQEPQPPQEEPAPPKPEPSIEPELPSRADQEPAMLAALLPDEAETRAAELPKLERVKAALTSSTSDRMFEGRDPRVRTQLVVLEGGSQLTEAAVAQGLRWLSRHQHPDGHWSLHRFAEHGDCDDRCGGEGSTHSDVGATGLALLPFLGAGQTHTRGMYQETVQRGIAWLLDEQKSNGDLRGDGGGQMYAHGIAAIVLCEAYALSGDESLRLPAQRAIDFIIRAQHLGSGPNTGGWRYAPGERGDTSVVGWQLMALRSGKMAGLNVPAAPFNRAKRFLDYVQQGNYGGLYSYQRGRSPEPAMIAEGLLCRQYLGWPADHRGLLEGVEFLLDRHLPDADNPNIYYWYYGTQVMHHIGGEPWDRWNAAMREALVRLQSRDGHEAGSWDPVGGAAGGHDVEAGGRLYFTALAICTLEVYYRHLPIYRVVAATAGSDSPE